MATASSHAPPKPVIPGVRPENTKYTSTGGSGEDSTTLSSSLQEASRKAVAAYRAALKDIPDMRRNFTIVEDESYVQRVIRDNFERHRDVTDPKIVDMLVFKATQELREIREQWKSRYHVYSYMQRYSEKLMREEFSRQTGAADPSDRREQILSGWRDKGLVPPELLTWPMFERWREEEDVKFRAFALQNKIFSEEQLDRNTTKSSSCTIM